MKQILTILIMLCCGVAYGQATVGFGANRTTDTSKTVALIKAPIYASSDTNKVLGVTSTGVITLRTKTTGGGSGTVTSVGVVAGTGVSIGGTSPITTAGVYTVTNTAPDQTVSLTNGTGISVTGTYPNFTITNTSPSSGGTVTDVTGVAPIQSSGGATPAISFQTVNALSVVANTTTANATPAQSVAYTSANTPSTLVFRDGSGNFSAGIVTATVVGNASTATALLNARDIYGNSFNGTANVTGVISMTYGGTGSAATTSVNGTPITYGANNTLAIGSGTVTDVIGGTNISITGTSTIQPTVNITGQIAVANGGTGVATQTSVNTTPITYGVDNTVTASALTLTTTTLNPTVVTSSLTSVGTITVGTWSSTIGSAATGSTQAINNNSTQIATTEYVDRYHPVDTSISAAYTLTSRDFHRTIHCTNGSNIALTIPTGLGTTFECVVLAEGAGTVTPTTSSTTFYYQPTSTTKIKSQGGATIRSWATANSYLIIGSLE